MRGLSARPSRFPLPTPHLLPVVPHVPSTGCRRRRDRRLLGVPGRPLGDQLPEQPGRLTAVQAEQIVVQPPATAVTTGTDPLLLVFEALFIGYLVIQAFRSDGWQLDAYAVGAVGLALVAGVVGWTRLRPRP